MAIPQPQLNFFPAGFGAGVVVRNVPLVQTHPGLVWWVSNNTTLPNAGLSPQSKQRIPYVYGADTTGQGTFARPFKTLGYALTIAGAGDIIFVKSGHAENVSTATQIQMATANVAVVGLGGPSTRPQLTFTTANTVTIPVSANDCSITNVSFIANFLSIASVFTLTTAKNFALNQCSFTDTSNVLTFISVVTTDVTANHADGLTINNCRWEGSTNTTATAMVTAGAIMDNMNISGNFVTLGVLATSGALVTGNFLHTNGLILNNIIYRLNASGSIGLCLDTSSQVCPSVIIQGNTAVLGQDIITAVIWTTTAGPALVNNYAIASSINTAQAALFPASDV